MSTPNPTSPAEPTSTPGATPSPDEQAAAILATLRTQTEGLLDALRLIQHTAENMRALNEREKRAIKAEMEEVTHALNWNLATSMMLRTPGDRRDELLRRIAADPEALKKDWQLPLRIDLELTKAEKAATDPEVS
jgi:hypothetical protein